MNRATLALAGLLLPWPALASAPQTAPDAPHAHGCTVILPDPAEHDDQPATLRVRTLRPLDECDGSAPVGYGASVRDGYMGRGM